jgi:hypothetical protein
MQEFELQVTQTWRRGLGQHPHTLKSMARHGIHPPESRTWNNAEELDLQVMEMRARLPGLEHPDTLLEHG